MYATVWLSLTIALVINGILFLIAWHRQSDKLTDASYALTFIALAIFTLVRSNGGIYVAIGVALVCIWALRIGGFLLYRVVRAGADHRFDGVREHFWKFGKFWLGQAITVWALLLPFNLAAHSDGPHGAWPFIGIVVWGVGFCLESIADLQKYRFSHNPQYKGQWIDTGLWRYSRHPNYFGEILVWVGIYLYLIPELTAMGIILGALSPLCIAVLLIFVSGIPILEKSADKRWDNIPEYQSYKRRTSLLVPLPVKSDDAE